MNGTRTRALGAILLAAVLSIVVAACGSDKGDSGAEGKNPLDSALHYMPKDTPFAASIQTNPSGSQVKNAEAILKKFPFAGQVERGLRQGLSSRKIDFDRDVKPVLGNQFVVASTDVRSFLENGSDDNRFVGAIKVKDKDAFQKVLDRDKPKKVGEVEGQDIERGGDNDLYVLDGDVFVVAGNRRDLEAAVKGSRADNHLTEADLDKATTELPKGAAVRAFFDARELLAASPDAAQARKITWVAALRDVGVTGDVQKDKLEIGFRANTDSGSLSDEDLPMASGADSPEVIERDGQIGFGVRGLDRIEKFVESALRQASPSDSSQFEQGKSTIEKQLGIDIDDDIVSQLSGDLSSSTAVDGRSQSRIKLDDPDAFAKTLTKVNKVVPGIANGAKVRKAGNGLFTVSGSNPPVVYGVVGDYFVTANSAAAARAVATEPAEKVEGAKGAIAFKADAGALVQAGLRQFAASFSGGSDDSPLGGLGTALGTSLFTGPLGDLTGSVEAETDAVSGNVSLSFK